jgi:hypothetical protein
MEVFSGLQGKSLYSGSGILWVRHYFLRKLDFQLCSRNRHFSPTVQPIEARECGETLSLNAKTFGLLAARFLMQAIPLLLRRMACGVQGQGVRAAELPSSPEIAWPL